MLGRFLRFACFACFLAGVLVLAQDSAFGQAAAAAEEKESAANWVIGYALFLLAVFICIFSVVRPGKRSFEIPDLE